MSTYEGSIKFSAEVDTKRAEEDLEKLGAEAEKAKNPVSGFSDAEKKASEQAENIERTAKQASLAVAAFGAAIVAGGAAAISASGEFESAFAQVQTIMDTEQIAVGVMRQDVLDLSVAAGIAATDVSAAVYQAISGSVDTADAVQFVEDANKLAVAGFTSLSNATDVLTTTLNAYKLSADSVAGVSNVLIQTQNLGKTSVDELAGSIGKAIPTAAAYNVNLQNLSTAYVELTRNGIATAESTTYINGMLNELGKAGSKVSGVLQNETGQSFGKLMSSGKSLGDVLGILLESVDGDTEAFANLWGSAEAGKAALAIVNSGIDDFNGVLADMNGQMEGVASTTDDAYNAMTQTSEFIDQKFDTSLENLGIAIGDRLRPKWDSFKSGVADVLDDLAEFVTNNPWVVSAMEALAAGAGVMSLGLLVTSGVVDTLKAKVIELTAVMESNPWILLATGIAMAAVGLYEWISASEEASEALVANYDAVKNLDTAITDAQEAYYETVGKTEAAANMADRYIDRLAELEKKETITADEQREWNSLLRLTAATLPDLADKINLETGEIEGGTAALKDNTEQWKQNAIEQAKAERSRVVYAAWAEAEIQHEYNTRMLEDSQERNRIATEEYDQLLNTARTYLKEVGGAWNDLSSDVVIQSYVQNLALEGQSDAAQEVLDSYESLTAEITDSSNAVSYYGTAVEKSSVILAEEQEKVDALEEAMAMLDETTEEAEDKTNGLSEAVQRAAATYDTAATELSDAWETAHDRISKSIDGQITMFTSFSDSLDTMASKTSEDTASMISALDSQLEYMETYAENMKTAAEMGVDEGLLASLNDGSTESAEILAGIVSGTEEQIAELNEKWKKVEEGKETFSDELTEYDEEVKTHKDTMIETATEAGIEIPKSLTKGLQDGFLDFDNVLSQYSTALTKLDRKMVGIGLPARGYATGTSYASPGIAVVGENGPEIVVFSGGERVINATETGRILTDAQRTSAMSATTPMPYTLTAGNGYDAERSASGRQGITITVPLSINGREFARATAIEMGDQLLYD